MDLRSCSPNYLQTARHFRPPRATSPQAAYGCKPRGGRTSQVDGGFGKSEFRGGSSFSFMVMKYVISRRAPPAMAMSGPSEEPTETWVPTPLNPCHAANLPAACLAIVGTATVQSAPPTTPEIPAGSQSRQRAREKNARRRGQGLRQSPYQVPDSPLSEGGGQPG